MLDVKKAVEIAFNTVQELYSGQTLTELALEEIELSDDEKFWHVTVGFNIPSDAPKSILTGAFPTFARKYKSIKNDSDSGKVKSMLIRQP